MSVLDLSSIELQTSDGRLLFQTAAARFNSGEFTVISGQMAAGKTCLAKLLAGLQACTKGQISCDGRLLRRSTDFRKARIRLSHQNPASQIIGHTVLEELSLGRDSTFALPWLEWAELNERADSDPRDLAFGEQRRLALAIALAEEPTFLLLDDPFLGLDQAFVPKLLRCLL